MGSVCGMANGRTMACMLIIYNKAIFLPNLNVNQLVGRDWTE